uniref:Uncharacterized protein n=1 Tax=Nymphaea colorata TaxID=210225 RepID=A0A5K0VBQ2_9MAGN
MRPGFDGRWIGPAGDERCHTSRTSSWTQGWNATSRPSAASEHVSHIVTRARLALIAYAV